MPMAVGVRIVYLLWQDPSEPDKIGMEGVVRFLDDLCLVRTTSSSHESLISHFIFSSLPT